MEMKTYAEKIPAELHEKLKLEVEELGISIPKYLEMVIEEHMTRKGEKDEHGRFKNSSSTGNRGFIFQTESSPRQEWHETERLLNRTIEDAIEKKKPNGKQSQRKPKKQKWKILRLRNQNRMKSQQNLKQKSLRQSTGS